MLEFVIQTGIMPGVRCPHCGSSRIYRDRYQGLKEFLRFSPFRPYGCRNCHKSFASLSRRFQIFNWQGGLGRIILALSAACPRCYSRELERISPRRLHGGFGNRVLQLLRVPAYRCAKCKREFFKLRCHIRYTPSPSALRSPPMEPRV